MRRALIPLALTAALAIPATADASTFIGKREFTGSGTLTYPTQRPSFLPVLGPTRSSADSISLRRVRWSGWGGDAAYATARTRVKTYDPWTYVRVRAYRPRSCPSNPPWTDRSTRFYTRVRVTAASWSHTWKAPTCSHVIMS
jgi:hypothetical protein